VDVSSAEDSTAAISDVTAADVWRLQAPLIPHDSEIKEINCAIQRFSKNACVRLTGSNHARHGAQELPTSAMIPVKLSPREGFVAPSGFVLMSADYSQIEFRILAHFTGDDSLIQPFYNKKVDVFKGICGKWKKKPPDAVSEAERDMTKQLCYAIIYGAGASRIAAVAGCSEAEARQLYSDFLHAYPSISRFIAIVKRDCRRHGFVTTLLGRRRYFPELQDSGGVSLNKVSIARLERQAVNTVCQGSAADLVKVVCFALARLAFLSYMPCSCLLQPL
jgi:DNA polymerase theta